MIAVSIGIGLLAGLMGGLLGVGGGLVIVPFLMFMDTNPKVAIGTSLAAIIPTALMATFRHHQLGNVQWKVVAAIAKAVYDDLAQ